MRGSQALTSAPRFPDLQLKLFDSAGKKLGPRVGCQVHRDQSFFVKAFLFGQRNCGRKMHLVGLNLRRHSPWQLTEEALHSRKVENGGQSLLVSFGVASVCLCAAKKGLRFRKHALGGGLPSTRRLWLRRAESLFRASPPRRHSGQGPRSPPPPGESAEWPRRKASEALCPTSDNKSPADCEERRQEQPGPPLSGLAAS